MRIFKSISKAFPMIAILAFSLFAISPFFNPGFFNIHDDTQVQRVFEMRKALSDGMFPVRWVSDLGYGYGYPIFNFYAPLPYYFGGLLSLVGLDALLATKIMIAGVVFGSSFSMYLLAREFWGKVGGLFAAVLYQFAPYHALDTYVRGDVGELYAYFFIPLIFYGIWKYYKEENFKYFLIGSLSYAGLITSHNLSAMMASPFIILIVLFLFIRKKKISILALPLLGILLSSFYAVPALLEINYSNVFSIIGGGSDFRDHFVCLTQLWYSPWGFGGSAPGCIDGMSFEVGKLHILLTLASAAAIIFLRKNKEKFWILILSLLAFVFLIFMMTEFSRSIWEFIIPMKFIQFPWRFLLLVSFFASFASGSIFYALSKFQKENTKWALFGLFVVLLLSPIIFYSKLFIPQNYLNKTSDDYTNQFSLNWTTSKISDEYMPKSFDTPKSKDEIIKNKISGNVRIVNLKSNTKEVSADLEAIDQTEITVHIPYFPAWNYYLNDKKINVREISTGVLLKVPKGKSKLVARFEQTSVEKVANLLSLSGVGLITLGIINSKKRKIHEKAIT